MSNIEYYESEIERYKEQIEREKESIKEADENKLREAVAKKFRSFYQAFVDAGFTEEQAWWVTANMIYASLGLSE